MLDWLFDLSVVVVGGLIVWLITNRGDRKRKR